MKMIQAMGRNLLCDHWFMVGKPVLVTSDRAIDNHLDEVRNEFDLPYDEYAVGYSELMNTEE